MHYRPQLYSRAINVIAIFLYIDAINITDDHYKLCFVAFTVYKILKAGKE